MFINVVKLHVKSIPIVLYYSKMKHTFSSVRVNLHPLCLLYSQQSLQLNNDIPDNTIGSGWIHGSPFNQRRLNAIIWQLLNYAFIISTVQLQIGAQCLGTTSSVMVELFYTSVNNVKAQSNMLVDNTNISFVFVEV